MTKLLGIGVAGIAAFTAACIVFIQLATSAPAGGGEPRAATSAPAAPSASGPRPVPRAFPGRSVPAPAASPDTDDLVERALGPGGAAAPAPEEADLPAGAERRPRRPSWSTREPD